MTRNPTDAIGSGDARQGGEAWWSPWRRRAVGALGASVMALTGCAVPVTAGQSPESTPSISSVEHDRDITPITEAAPSSVKEVFKQSAERGISNIDVSATSMTSEFQELFMTHERTDLTSAELLERTDDVLTDIEKAHDKLDLPSLPENFDVLLADAVGEQKLSLRTYKNAARKFFSSNFTPKGEKQSNVRIYFDLDQETIDNADLLGVEESGLKEIKPDNPSLRSNIMQIMDAYARLPKSLVPEHEIGVFDVINNDDHGYTTEAYTSPWELEGEDGKLRIKTIVVFNAGLQINNLPEKVLHELRSVAVVDEGPQMFRKEKGGYYRDPAFLFLNPEDLRYGPEVRDEIEAQGKTSEGYTVLDAYSSDGKVAAVTAESFSERGGSDDHSWLFSLLISGDLARLFAEQKPGVDLSVVQLKTAYELARIKEIDADLARWIELRFEAVRLGQEIHTNLNKNPNSADSTQLQQAALRLDKAAVALAA